MTLRRTDDEPIDAMVENLSQTGFAMSTIADLGIGSIIGLSIGGALRRRVRIVRRVGLAYGCEFLAPLSDLEVSAALRTGDVIAVDFVANEVRQGGAVTWDQAHPRKLNYVARAYILGGLLITLWGVLIAIVWRFF